MRTKCLLKCLAECIYINRVFGGFMGKKMTQEYSFQELFCGYSVLRFQGLIVLFGVFVGGGNAEDTC